ncbi:MAG: family 2A encapsulin nanocompartment cargo protein cysteine desulfurase [Methylobacter sp.]|nr:family 2A encapsulin nanocompartment cargo protein cysteine desulfurase [Methylobacter sp.]
MNTTNAEPVHSAQKEFSQNAALPDIEQLSQWANELFTALPCDGSRIGLISSAVRSEPSSPLTADKSALAQGSGLPGEAELQELFAPRQPAFETVPDALDTDSVFGKPSSASPLAGLDKSVLEGMLPHNFGLPDEAQLQQLLVSRVPSDNRIPGNTSLGSIPAAPFSAADSDLLANAERSTQGIEAELQKLFGTYTAAAGNLSKSAASNPATAAAYGPASSLTGLDTSLIAGLSPQVYGLPGEDELQKLFVASAPVPARTESASSFYFLDELKTGGFNAQTPTLAAAHPAFDVQAIRRDFPILKEQVNGQPLVWFDNAATTQKPQVVIDRVSYFYQHENSNIHRAAHELAARSTDAYEKSRNTVARFINAPSSSEIVFVRGTTEAINLVAHSWGRQNIGAGDEIVITWLEHHANIVPWKQLCDVTGAKLRVVPVDDDGQVVLDDYQKLLNSRTKLVSFTQVSNALGTVTPAREMIEMARRVGARVLLDGAQSISHLRVDVQALDCDWFVFSGHKIFGPTGIGVLFGKAELLEAMPPWQGGGNMIEDVTFEKIVYQPAPARFEAGTGNIADAVGLAAAIEYLLKIGIDNIARYEHDLLVYAMAALNSIPGLRLIGTAAEKTSVLSFVLHGHSNQDIGVALNRVGIAVRTGHHCAQPILRRFGLESTVRPSLAFYNTHEEVDLLVSTVRRIQSGTGF